ncbi:hypothetical protein [Marinobacterium arenosum]|uniref:hypothetical protein n=1 Tax=Marinobacterium arenosum TaxID=2862496 RepID=UPI001C96CE93|nr:hypothetical protein [Marinobacterium arenosum]MBY4677576.1 hypothetical protein [Marinobacterium arenosum]
MSICRISLPMKHLCALLALLLTLTSLQAAGFVSGGSAGCAPEQHLMSGPMTDMSSNVACADLLDDCERSCFSKQRPPLSYAGTLFLAPDRAFIASRLCPPVLAGFAAGPDHPPKI